MRQRQHRRGVGDFGKRASDVGMARPLITQTRQPKLRVVDGNGGDIIFKHPHARLGQRCFNAGGTIPPIMISQNRVDAYFGVQFFEFARKVGEHGVLYGSVTSMDIAEAIAAKGFEIDRRKIQLAEPIKQTGDFEVPVKLHREVTATVKITVKKEEEA